MSSKLLETVADIAYIAGEHKYYTGNSRDDIFDFIYWAKEFEKQNKKTNWGFEKDYITAVTEFTDKKISNKDL